MDFALSSSAVLGAAVFLWLLWVAPYVLRRLRPATDGAALLMDSADASADAATRGIGANVSPTTPRAEDPPAASSNDRVALEEGEHVTNRTPAEPKLHIRWGRCALAGVGLGGLLVAIVGGVLATLGVARGWIPLVGLAATAGTVFVLRTLAVRDRRRRVNAVFRAAVRLEVEAPAREIPRRISNEVFDLQPESEPAPRLSRDELRAAALEVAKAAQNAAAEAAAAAQTHSDSWEPVEVPKPAYVDAAKAERGAPEPLQAPEQPKPSAKVTIKPKPDGASAPGVPVVPTARPAARGALGNLDAVLQRRRA